jgi:type I restriction enzyme, R subunit
MTSYAGGRRLESTILHALTGKRVDLTPASRDRMETSGGWLWGKPEDFDQEFALDPQQLWAFLSFTQITSDADRKIVDLTPGSDTRQPFLGALGWEISRRGVVDVLRRGMSYGPLHLLLFYGLSSPPPHGSMRLYRQNRFSVTPRLLYSRNEQRGPLSLCLFINGLPIITLELADGSEMITVEDAVDWYKHIRTVEEPLFQRGRCVAHFAVDDRQVSVCADLREGDSVFLPFNQGLRDDETNPPRLFGVPTEYLWRRILTRRSVADIIENYAHIVSTVDDWSGRPRLAAIFPRYHQLDVGRRLLADIDYYGVGRRYLIQHAVGSGKSQSMVWLISQLLDIEVVDMAQFGTVVVVTDRPSSDRWLPETIRHFSRLSAIVDARVSDRSRIEELLESPNRIIVVDVRDFPFVLDEIKVHFHGYGYAIVIDETQSSSGRDWHSNPADSMEIDAPGESMEDQVNRAMHEREFLPNASYLVFTATPNDATLEIFGQPYNDRGVTRYRPFHEYGVR